MPDTFTAFGFANGIVARESIQYVYDNPGSLPSVINGAVKSTVRGSHIAGGSLTSIFGIGFTASINVAIESQPAVFVRFTEYVPDVV